MGKAVQDHSLCPTATQQPLSATNGCWCIWTSEKGLSSFGAQLSQTTPGQVINRYNITSLICQSYIKTSTPSNIVNSFSKIGIFPFNPEVIDPVRFMPSKITHPTTDDHTLSNEGTQGLGLIQDSDIDAILESRIPKVKVSQASKKRQRDPAGEALTEGNTYLDLKERKMAKKLPGTSTAPSGPKVVGDTEEEDVIVLPQVSKSGRRIVSRKPWSPQAGPSRCIYNPAIQQKIQFVLDNL